MNVVVLRGVLSSEPRVRDLPSGTVLLQWELTTPLRDQKLSVPVTWFDPPKTALGLAQGAEIVVLGSVRRRFYRSAGRVASSTEVVAEAATAVGRKSRVEQLRSRAISEIGG